jgi:hypothetical protein
MLGRNLSLIDSPSSYWEELFSDCKAQRNPHVFAW